MGTVIFVRNIHVLSIIRLQRWASSVFRAYSFGPELLNFLLSL